MADNGGVLTAAHVPLLIRARNRSEQYGEEFEQRLFTVLLGALAAITLARDEVPVACACSCLRVGGWPGPPRHGQDGRAPA